jgi:hypothetical protein
MQPHQRIDIQLVNSTGDPVRLAKVLPEIRFFYKGKLGRPRYRFDVWSTDGDGHCVISFEDLDMKRRLLGNGDLMDFNTPLTECDPMVEIWIPPESEFELRKQHMWRESWWRPAWLTDWPANGLLEPSDPKRVTLSGRITPVEMIVDLL